MAPTVVTISAAKERYSISKDKEPLHHSSGFFFFDSKLHKIYGYPLSFDSFATSIPRCLNDKSCDLDMNNNDNSSRGVQKKSVTETGNAVHSFKNPQILTFPSKTSSKYESSNDGFTNNIHYLKSKKNNMAANLQLNDACEIQCDCQSYKSSSKDCICNLLKENYDLTDKFADVTDSMAKHIQYRKGLCEGKFVDINKSMDRLNQRLRKLQTTNVLAHVSSHVDFNRCLKSNNGNQQSQSIRPKKNVWKEFKKIKDMVQLDIDYTESEDDLESPELVCNTFGRCRRKSDNPPPSIEVLNKWKRKRSCIGSQCSWLSLNISALDRKISDIDEICSQQVALKNKYEYNNESYNIIVHTNEISDENLCQRTSPYEHYKKHNYVKNTQTVNGCFKCFFSIIPCYQCLQCRKQSPQESCAARIGKLDDGYHPILSSCNEICLSLSLEEVFRKQKIRSKIKVSKIKHKKSPLTVESSYEETKNICPALNTRLSERKHLRWRNDKADDLRYNAHAHRKRSRIISATNQGRLRKSRKSSDSKDITKPSTPTELVSPFSSGISSAFLPLKKKKNSSGTDYDINNIVIPYSMAASTRLERIQYKEITTPGWRKVKPILNTHRYLDENFIKLESTEDDAFLERHLQCEIDEKGTNTYYHQPLSSRRKTSYHLSENNDSGPPSPLLFPDSRTAVVTPLDVSLSNSFGLNRLHNLVRIPEEEREATWPLRTYPLNLREKECLSRPPQVVYSQTMTSSDSSTCITTGNISVSEKQSSMIAATQYEDFFTNNTFSSKLSNSFNSNNNNISSSVPPPSEEEGNPLISPVSANHPIETQLLTPAETPLPSPTLSCSDNKGYTDIAGNMIYPMI